MISPFHVGTLLLFIALVFLVVASASAPGLHTLGFMKISDSSGTLVFGTFGFCVTGSRDPWYNGCSKSSVSYDIGGTVAVYYTDWEDWEYISSLSSTSLRILTGFLILNPIAAGLTLVAFLVALAGKRTSFLSSSMIALAACIATLLAVTFDFVTFGIFRYLVNGFVVGPQAEWSSATWLALAASVLLILATSILFQGWRSERRKQYSIYVVPAQEATFRADTLREADRSKAAVEEGTA
ncbi:uncharacterized protein EI90DRAFT_3047711 [Cantharellus anzutake]|uniref:uncharacterized protein n=1 Tax=Cantharellus anzutake TaxID=1750568 RepID=UPI001903150E|nr:uncharacterized protein EI90DRAFT_3047711 [Cantharellus anzutake]KAF8335970.1 hypothetical protein EI90DRAFT_3047711 [Cantharellus anzutake]